MRMKNKQNVAWSTFRYFVLAFLLCLSVVPLRGQPDAAVLSSPSADSLIIFSYPSRIRMFKTEYADNRLSLRKLKKRLRTFRKRQDTLYVQSYSGSWDDEKSNLRAAYWRANNLKGYLIDHYGLRERHFRTLNHPLAWRLDNGCFVFEDAFWASQGLNPRQLSFKEFMSFIHPDHWEGVKFNWRNLKSAHKKIVQELCNFDGKGYQWWEFRYTTKQLPGGEYKTAGLLLNIQDIKDCEEELEAARLLAEKAELKQSFLANMSHEIRTPLNSIVGFANILALEDGLSSVEREEYISTINKNSELLLKLINDILELSRIESGYMSFSFKRCKVRELIDDIYMTHQVLIASHLEFLKEMDDTPLEINVDRERLIQVLTNFLNNACKFTETGYIKLGYSYLPDEGNVQIYVEDSGRGIPREEQRMIFSRFYKQNEFSQGAGLGLSICQVIIEKLGGKIELKSEVGKGSRFTVILPCRVVS